MTLPGITPERVFVIDTSSILEVRRLLSQATDAQVRRVFERLTMECRVGALSFPSPVFRELERGHDELAGTKDAPFDWIQATRFAEVADTDLFDEVRQVLSAVPTLVDHSKTSGADDADPYVVALALRQRNAGFRVTVVSDDRKDEPNKTGIQSACGLMEIPAVSMRGYLRHLKVQLPG